LYIRASNVSKDNYLHKIFPLDAEQPSRRFTQYLERRDTLANSESNTLSSKYPCKTFMSNLFDHISNFSEKFDLPIIISETKDVFLSSMEHSPDSSQATTQDQNIENDYGTSISRSDKLNQQLEQFKNRTTDDHEITVQSADIDLDGFTSMDPLIGSSSNVGRNKNKSKAKSIVETIHRQPSTITNPESLDSPQDDEVIVELNKNKSQSNKRNSGASRQGGWSQNELNYLIKGMEKYGTSWSSIEKKYGGSKGPLKKRTQMHMKDKARSELKRRLRSGLSPGIFGKEQRKSTGE
ncbi:2394_t:CDS:2, partial [Scutellospora calospora]